MGPEPSDAAAITRSIADPHAFEDVFERRFDAVHSFLRRRVGADLADELAAEAFARAFAQRARFVARHDSALPWLLGIASNLVGDHRRAERRRLAALARAAGEQGAGGRGGVRGAPAASASAAAAAAAPLDGELARALAALHPRDRDALLLIAWGELSYEEVADALAIPIGTVRSRVNRARGRLRKRLGAPATTAPTPGESHA